MTASSHTVNITGVTDDSDHVPASLEVYIIAVPVCSVVFILYAVIFLQMAATAGQRLHDRMLASVMNATSHIFNSHFIGMYGFISETFYSVSNVLFFFCTVRKQKKENCFVLDEFM